MTLGAALLLGFAAAGGSPAQTAFAAEPAPRPAGVESPLTPAAALASFRLEPGLRVELAAAEPLVESPVAIAWDERGRLFVVENRGYPTGPPPGQPPQGRVAMLEDTDHDGVFDRRVEFADALTYPNGLMPWRGGWLVSCAPDLLYLKDTDGDGRADLRQVWFTGFSTTGSTQLRASHPMLAIDNWIYLTGGLTGGKVTSPLWPEHPAVEFRRADFRFRPDEPMFESADGGGQFGMTFDEFGQRFVCYNRVQAQHVALSSAYLRRNPRLAFAQTLHNCPTELGSEPAPGHGVAARIYPISDNITTADSHAGEFTAACGVTIYRGAGLPAVYQGGAFSCDPTGNLVHFDRIEPLGATFAAKRSPEPVEFLASPDNWFRPVFLATGPEGALYVCDMYRKTIEHPDYLPGDVRKQTDFEAGKDRGRVYRVVADPPREPAGGVALDRASVEELCAALADAQCWRRDTAQRLLLERRDPASAPALKRLLAAADSPPVAVVHALRLLEALGAVDDGMLRTALAHASPRVREHALRMAEPRLAADASLLEAALPLAGDSDARVRFQWALSVGAVDDPRALERLAEIAARDAADPWLRAAALSSIPTRELSFLRDFPVQPAAAPATPTRESGHSPGTQAAEPGMPALFEELGRLVGASLPQRDLPEGLRAILADRPGWKYDEPTRLLVGFADAIQRRKPGATLSSLLQTGAGMSEERGKVARAADDALRIARDAGQPAEYRAAALALLGCDGNLAPGADLLDLVQSNEPAVQAASIRAVAARGDPQFVKQLLAADRFAGYSPAQRAQVLQSLFAEPQLVPCLLDAVEAGAIPRGAVDSIRRRQLTEHRDAAIRERAARLFSPAAAGDRAKVYEDYKSVADLPGRGGPGRRVFAKACANCHRLNREGYAVGPDLFGIRNKPKQVILLHVLLPEYEITPGFTVYVAQTKDGRVIPGLLTADSGASVTLRQALGKEETILRSDIETISASQLSLMPQEIEKTMSRQDMADLLAYLKGEPD